MPKRRRVHVTADYGGLYARKLPKDLIRLGKQCRAPTQLDEIVNELMSRRGAILYAGEIELLRRRAATLRALTPKPATLRRAPARVPSAPMKTESAHVPTARCSRLSPAASRQISNLHAMGLPDMVQLWRNCIRILDDGGKAAMHVDARGVLEAIGKEWTARRFRPPDPKDFFRWPSTDAQGGRYCLETSAWLPEGMLQFMGYTVGKRSELSGGQRRLILTEIFRRPLPPAFPRAYMDEWHEPDTALRLRKLAETIAAITRNARRRRDSLMVTAITHWEQDLRFLYDQFYVGTFQFVWPATS